MRRTTGSSPKTVRATTLENLVLSLPIADRLGAAPDGHDILLVTDSTHVLRSYLLMRVIGRGEVQFVASNTLDQYARREWTRTILREAGANWLNVAKVAAWGMLALAGLTPEERLAYVR